jgi:Domain of Unknown Function (DUF928)
MKRQLVTISILAISLLFLAANAAEGRISISKSTSTVPKKNPRFWYEKPGKSCWKDRKDTINPVCAANKNTSVEQGGQIFTDENTTVEIICSDNQKGSVSRNNYREGMPIIDICRSPNNSQTGGDVAEVFRSGGFDSEIPYVVSPRYTLLHRQPSMLQWRAVQNARNYKVSLFQDQSKQVICKIDNIVAPPKNGVMSIEFSLCQKDSKPYQLEVGNFYRIEVTVSNSKISSKAEVINLSEYHADQREVQGIEFSLINPQKSKEVSELIKDTDSKVQNKEQQYFRRASIYASFNLYSEAILTLEELVKDGSSDPDIYIRLGDYYASSGLISLAESSYYKAKVLIKLKKDDSRRIHDEQLKVRFSQIDKIKSNFNRKISNLLK